MPSTRPQAAFEAISPFLNVQKLVEETPNFEWAARINCDMIDLHGLDQFERLVLVHVILGGKPLVIDNYQSKLDSWTFSVQWLKDNWGKKIFDARDLTADKNVPLTMSHYLEHMSLLASQWDEKNFKDKTRQRMYLKDIDCPPMWADKLKSHIPLGMFYMNESTGDVDGVGAVDEPDPKNSGIRRGRGVAKAGDLMSGLPSEMRAENLMCYIGHEGTYTPAHREMCASLGQNIMVEASKATIEDGKVTQPGSSIWFMTETKEREVVSEYWLSRLGHDIEIEKHFAQVNAWKQAPFKVYVIEQHPGDLILIPPLAPHQVWNRGTRTMKVAWNRTTVETLEMAMDEALPKARMVCRDEQYKNKAIIFYTLQKYSGLLSTVEKQRQAGVLLRENDNKVKQVQKDFKRLQNLFTRIMVSEHFLPDKPEKNVELVPYDSNITCSYCRCNIFNRFLTCKNCVIENPDGDDDTYDVCMDCYAMGRSCACISKLNWVEQWKWDELNQKHELFRRQIIEFEGKIDAKSPKSLRTELNLLEGRRTLAQICQIELTRRPFQEVQKTRSETNAITLDDDEIDEVDANGNVKKKKKVRRSEKYIREHGRCHIDCYWEPKWKQAQCSKCDKNYCYGNLYRAYDMMPQDVVADPKWKCPSCRKICGCRQCRHKPGFKQYKPRGTMLGHNTRAVADSRSIESLVDFSFSNIAWIQKAGDDHEEDTHRLRRKLKEAEAAKAKKPQLGEENYVDSPAMINEDVENRLTQLAEQDGIPVDSIPIDPALNSMTQQDDYDVDGRFTIVEHPEGDPDLFAPFNQLDGGPQYFVPEGGVIWDNEHAYDDTSAITYVYPDLNSNVQLPPAPTDGYNPALVPGYEPAMPPEKAGKIEMVDRKRKRKLEDEDRPYKSHKTTLYPKSKARKSLVVKLAVNRERLAELDRSMSNIQMAATENVSPVVVGSDLQALNVERQAPALQHPARRNRDDRPEGEMEIAEPDDDFTPGRSRDRRRHAADGPPLDKPVTEAPRRTTRMQAVTYAEPDEDEEDEDLDEIAIPKPAASKLATMERAVKDARSAVQPTPVADKGQVRKWPAANTPISSTQNLATQQNSVASNKTTTKSNNVQRKDASTTPSSQAHVVRLGPEASSGSSSSGLSCLQPVAKTIQTEVSANRRAKMAAIEGSIDIDDIDDDDEIVSVVASTDDQPSAEDDSKTSSSSEDEVPSSIVKKPAPHKPVGGKAPKFSLMKTAPVRSVTPETAPPPPSKPFVKKASAADWSDSDSDDVPYAAVPASLTANHRTSLGYMAANAGRTNHHVSTGATAKRGRGRPPRYG